jgi:hypothetical protein
MSGFASSRGLKRAAARSSYSAGAGIVLFRWVFRKEEVRIWAN